MININRPRYEMESEVYRKIVKVGEGTYGVVYKGLHVPTGTTVAIKKIKYVLF